uniref:Metalloendopeptidase n=1 Tax=Strongyloides venezuelensis TaxID=75913 RepID=A0A0K0EXP4_STRVS
MNHISKVIFLLLTLIFITNFVYSLYNVQSRKKRSGTKTDTELINFPVRWCLYLEPGKRYNQYLDVNITLIQLAVTKFQDRSCLQFVQEANCPAGDVKFPLIKFVGDLKNKINNYHFNYQSKVQNPYEIKVEYNCNKRVGCIIKKLLAYMGFFMTQRRIDRDQYITVNNDYILDHYKNDYEKIDKDYDLANTGYDYGSVMHASKFYGKNYSRGDTFNINPEQYELMVGQEYGLSFNDYKIVNYRYCSEKCPNKLSCKNGGFQSPEGCKYCECPNGYKGNLCEEIEESSLGCGDNKLSASSDLKVLTFNGRRKCNVLITANVGRKIEIKVNDLRVPTFNPCFENHGLEIKYRADKSLTGLCLCMVANDVTVTSENNEVFIQYNGDGTTHLAKIEYREI